MRLECVFSLDGRLDDLRQVIVGDGCIDHAFGPQQRSEGVVHGQVRGTEVRQRHERGDVRRHAGQAVEIGTSFLLALGCEGLDGGGVLSVVDLVERVAHASGAFLDLGVARAEQADDLVRVADAQIVVVDQGAGEPAQCGLSRLACGVPLEEGEHELRDALSFDVRFDGGRALDLADVCSDFLDVFAGVLHGLDSSASLRADPSRYC